MKLILFEDTESQATSLLTAIRKWPAVEVLHFQGDVGGVSATYEKKLQVALQGNAYLHPDLIVADRDLSKTPGYGGLSEGTVRRVAETLGIPECSYARNNEVSLIGASEKREANIVVSIANGEDACARQLVSIASGFKCIRAKLDAMQHEPLIGGSVGKTLAAILDKPEYTDKIGLYASGDQHRLHLVLKSRGDDSDARIRNLTCFFGYWLWDSILRFPGLLVNPVAASSYLNIHVEEFGNLDVQDLFVSAIYEGPFADAMPDKHWWRGMLDDILFDANAEDGRDYASVKLGRTLRASQCCEDSQMNAGYYCMLSHQPVSFANSKGGLPWFPRGADLARVSNSQDEELGPWL
ncbi:MAG: hypothetical protein U0930_14295 [Pirellulales bacterium]